MAPTYAVAGFFKNHSSRVLLLVGSVSFQGKMPDYSSDLFFLQTTIFTLIGPLFRNNPEIT